MKIWPINQIAIFDTVLQQYLLGLSFCQVGSVIRLTNSRAHPAHESDTDCALASYFVTPRTLLYLFSTKGHISVAYDTLLLIFGGEKRTNLPYIVHPVYQDAAPYIVANLLKT